MVHIQSAANRAMTSPVRLPGPISSSSVGRPVGPGHRVGRAIRHGLSGRAAPQVSRNRLIWLSLVKCANLSRSFTVVVIVLSVCQRSFIDRSGGTSVLATVTLLIFADWVPPDFCASRSCLTLGTDISAGADALNVHEDSPPAAVPPETSMNEHLLYPRHPLRRG